jgi:hypothetical protein
MSLTGIWHPAGAAPCPSLSFESPDVRTPMRLWHGDENETLAAPVGLHLAGLRSGLTPRAGSR